jgi:hypothetical protein
MSPVRVVALSLQSFSLQALPLLALLLLALGGAACGDREEGTALVLTLAHAPARGAEVDGEGRHFTLASGARVTLHEGWVTLASVEVLPCPESALRHPWRWLAPVPTAHAHGTASPTRLATPHVSSLARPDGEPLTLGELHPPAGRYCSARLIFGPADADAEDLPPDVDMVGRSLRLTGEVQPPDAQSPAALALVARGVAVVDVPLDPPLVLDAGTLRATLPLTLAYDRWLEDVELAGDGADAAQQALDAVAASATRRE